VIDTAVILLDACVEPIVDAARAPRLPPQAAIGNDRHVEPDETERQSPRVHPSHSPATPSRDSGSAKAVDERRALPVSPSPGLTQAGHCDPGCDERPERPTIAMATHVSEYVVPQLRERGVGE
jgi:hypothetical protein